MSWGPSTMGPTSREVLEQKEHVVTFRPRNPPSPPEPESDGPPPPTDRDPEPPPLLGPRREPPDAAALIGVGSLAGSKCFPALISRSRCVRPSVHHVWWGVHCPRVSLSGFVPSV